VYCVRTFLNGQGCRCFGPPKPSAKCDIVPDIKWIRTRLQKSSRVVMHPLCKSCSAQGESLEC